MNLEKGTQIASKFNCLLICALAFTDLILEAKPYSKQTMNTKQKITTTPTPIEIVYKATCTESLKHH